MINPKLSEMASRAGSYGGKNNRWGYGGGFKGRENNGPRQHQRFGGGNSMGKSNGYGGGNKMNGGSYGGKSYGNSSFGNSSFANKSQGSYGGGQKPGYGAPKTNGFSNGFSNGNGTFIAFSSTDLFINPIVFVQIH